MTSTLPTRVDPRGFKSIQTQGLETFFAFVEGFRTAGVFFLAVTFALAGGDLDVVHMNFTAAFGFAGAFFFAAAFAFAAGFRFAAGLDFAVGFAFAADFAFVAGFGFAVAFAFFDVALDAVLLTAAAGSVSPRSRLRAAAA